MTMTLKPFTPDCGHKVTPKPGSVGTGKAIDPDTGVTMCYPCAEKWEQERIKAANVYSAYLTDLRPDVITTWTGGVLAKVVSYSKGARQYTPTGGSYRMRYVTARTPDGALWRGQGGDSMDVITLRRVQKI